MDRPSADVSVRVAWGDDANAIGQVQVNAWREGYAALLPADVLDSLDPSAFADQWHRSILTPKEARQRVLVALERASVRGFAATAPCGDADANPATDGELVEFVVDPAHRAQGHGSRLLHAAVDTLLSDKFTHALIWLNSTDDSMRGFLEAQGWAPDQAHRELDLHGDGTVVVKQVRLHTAISSR